MPVEYFHVVFTLPAEIAQIAYWNKKAVYGLLFKASAETVKTIAANPKRLGVNVGLTSVLHTWGSAMTHHPHIHMIVPSGGLSPDGNRWVACKPGFFLPVRVLSRLFRRLFLDGLMALHRAGDLAFFGDLEHLVQAGAFAAWLAPFRKSKWVVYSKPPFGGPEAVLAYLSRYTHRVAISNTATSPIKAPNAVAVTAESEYDSGATVTLDGSGSSVDRRRGPIAYTWARTSGTDNLEVMLSDENAQKPTFTADSLTAGAQDVTHTFTLTVMDSTGASATDTVTVTVISGFADPVAMIAGAAEREVASGETEMLDGSGSTFDSRRTPLTYAWTRADGTTTGLTNPNTATPIFTAETLTDGAEDVTHILTLTVTDSGGGSDTATVTITVTSGFADPVAIIASAAEREVDSGGTEMLDGSGSTFDSRRTPLTYAWTRADGTTTGLTNPATATPIFTAETLTDGAEDVTHILTLTVTDSGGGSDTATVTIKVISGFADPVAIIAGAAEREVASGGTVTLDGSGSTFDSRRTPLTYAWTRADGTTTGLTNPATATPIFTAETLTDGAEDVTHILTLTVTDSGGGTNEATVTIKVISGFTAPVAIIAGGDQSVASGATVPLDGSGSTHDDRTSLAHAWTRADGTTTGLTNADMEMASFRPPTLTPGDPDATHTLTLTVTEVGVTGRTPQSAEAMVTITVISDFAAPVAIIADGNQSVDSGGTVDLDGSGSTYDSRTSLAHAWTRADGTTTGLTNPNTATPRFTPPTLTPGDPDATHILTLTVTDGESGSASATVTITVISDFADPVAIITGGNRSVDSGGTVDLDSSDSTHDSRTSLTHAWTRADGTTMGLTDPNTDTPIFTAETLADGAEDVTHTLTLTVTDSEGGSASATVEITVNAPAANVDPVAEAGDPQRRVTGGLVTLDGSGSMDSDALAGETLDYSWLRATGAGEGSGGTVTLSDPTAEQPTFTAPTPNAGAADVTYGFTLTVTDADGVESEPDTVTITINAPPRTEAGEYEVWDSGALVTFDGSASFDSREMETYNWVETPAGNVTLTDANTDTPSFQADPVNPGAADVEYVFTLTVTDDDGIFDTDTATITINAPPKADAGDPQTVPSGESVVLDGGDSSDTTGTWTHDWERTGGTGDASKVTLTGEDSAELTVTPTDTVATQADAVTHIFTLTVTDAQGETAEDTVTVTVEEPLVALAATVDPTFEVEAGTAETISGTAMIDRRKGPARYSWARTGGDGDASKVTLTGQNTASLGFTAETRDPGAADVTHVYRLTVTDKDGETATADTTITVVSPTVGLVANAGMPTTVASGTTPVTLDGNGSTGDDRAELSYAWERTGGTGDASTVTLTGKDTATPSFTAETLADLAASVTHIFTLTVTDDRGSTADTDTVEITVIADLVAHAGTDQTVGSGATVPLDGRLSTVSDSGRDVTYAWARTSGTGDSSLVSSDPAARETSFTAETLTADDPSVTHIFTLTVTDNKGSTLATDTVTITVTADLVANAGVSRESVGSGALEPVILRSTGSTASDSGRTVTYAWTRSGTGGTLADADKATARFTAPALNPGDPSVTYTFTLTVTDGEGGSASDTVTITVNGPPGVPIKDLGPDRTLLVIPGGTVTLDGSGPNDGMIKSWLWERTGGTSDPDDVDLDGEDTAILRVSAKITADTAQTGFVANTAESDDPGKTHIFTLTVTYDDDGIDISAPVTVIISSVSVDDIRVSTSELTVQEGGTGSYRVRLGKAPRQGQTVTVRATSDDEDKVKLENPSLEFGTENWAEWQDVKISTVADSDNKDGEVRIRHSLVANGETQGEPGGVVTVTVREVDPILRPIGEFLATRATALLGQQPNLTGFLKQDGTTPGSSGNFSFRATDDRLAMSGGFVHNGVWGEVNGSYVNSESGDTKSVLGAFGIHRRYSERFLAGAMLQFDLAEQDLAGKAGTIEGTGWLAGPYFAARHNTRPLYFEGRLLYGQFDSDIRFNDTGTGIGVRTGAFDSKRLLAQLRMEGEIALSADEDGGVRLIPYADMRWIEDRAAGFTDNVNNRVPGQKVSIGQFELGSNVEIPIAVRTGAMTLTGGLGLVWSNTEGDYIPSESGGRGRGEIGFSYDLDDDLRIDLDSFYDGIGTSRYEGYGLSLSAEMKF